MTRSFRLSVLLLTLALPCGATVGEKATPKAEIALTLDGPAELGQPFQARARARFAVAARNATFSFLAPSGLKLDGGYLALASIAAGQEVTVSAKLLAETPVAGVELKVELRFIEGGVAGSPVEETRTLARSIFLTIDRNEGGEGLPGDLWTAWLPAGFGEDAGFVLRSYGAAEGALGRYAKALAELTAGRGASAAARFAGLAVEPDAELAVAAGNGLAVARALGRDPRGAQEKWTELLGRRDVPDRVAAYLLYNRALLHRKTGNKAGAAADLGTALARHPGFSAARRMLQGTK